MHRTITPIAVLGASLVLAVPALGQSQSAKPQWQRALEVRSQELNRQHGLGQYDPALRALRIRSEALNRRYGLGQASPAWLDVFMRGQAAIDRQAAYPYSGSTLAQFIANDNRFRPRPTSPTVAVSASSGSEVEWPQIGIGLGVGIALVLGLILAVRATRQRPLAH